MLSELVECMVKAMVDDPDAVEVSEATGERTSVIELKVAKGDIGKVIGKQGRNIHAIRAILGAVSSKLHRRAVLEIID